MEAFEQPHPEEARSDPLYLPIVPFSFPHEEHEGHQDSRQPTQRFDRGMERRVQPHPVRRKGSDDHAGEQSRRHNPYQDEILRREFVFHFTLASWLGTVSRGRYDGMTQRSSEVGGREQWLRRLVRWAGICPSNIMAGGPGQWRLGAVPRARRLNHANNSSGGAS